MVKPSSPDPENASLPPESDRNQRSFPWFWLGTLVGTVLSTAGIGLIAWAYIFIQKDLSPLLSKTLTQTLARPVEVGDVKSVTLSSLQIGPSTVGASATDPATLTADTTIVQFDLLKTLFHATFSKATLDVDLTLVGADGYLKQSEEKGWLNVTIPPQENRLRRFKVQVDDVRIRDSRLTLVPLPPPSGQLKPIDINQLSGKVDLAEVTIAGQDSRRARFEVAGKPVAGGGLTVKGEVQPVAIAPNATGSNSSASSASDIKFATNFAIQADKAPLSDILNFTLSTIGQATDRLTLASGQVSGAMTMAIRPQQPVEYKGAVSVAQAEIGTTLVPLPVTNLVGQARFQNNLWTVDRLSGKYGKIGAIAKGLVDFNQGYNLTVAANNVTATQFIDTISLQPPVPVAGNFDAIAQVTGPISQPQATGNVRAITPIAVDKLSFTDAATAFLFQNQMLLLNNITAVPTTGGALQGSGQIALGQGSPFSFNIVGNNLPAREIASLYNINAPFTLGLISADAKVTGGNGSVNTTLSLAAPGAQYPGSATLDINGRAIAFRDANFRVGSGTVSASGTWVDGRWNSTVALNSVQLNSFSDALQGPISGQLQLSGNTADNRLAAIVAQGKVSFANGLSTFNSQFNSFNSPLTAQVAWNGQQLVINRASSDRLTASGTLTPTLNGNRLAGIDRFNLNISAQDYALADLPFSLPASTNLTGRTNFKGTLTGSPSAPNFKGNLQIAGLAVNQIPFNSLLSGTVAYSPSIGLALNVAGGTDKIDLTARPTGQNTLNSSTLANLNLNFDIAWQDTFARGQTQGSLLTVQAGNFPLSVLNLPASGVGSLGQLRGTLTTADLAINLGDRTFEGNVAIDQLGLGYISAGKLTGQVRYANNLATLTGGKLAVNNNLYMLNARLATGGPAPVYRATLATEQGNVQDFLTALSIDSLQDFRRGLNPPNQVTHPSPSLLDTLLASSPAGYPDALIFQLRRLSEIQTIQAEAEAAAAKDPLPPLRQLNGPINGSAQLTGTGSDFNLSFDLAGNSWQWGPNYHIDQVIAQGSLTPNALTLQPLRFASNLPIPSSPNSSNSSTSNTAALNIAGQLVYGNNTKLTSSLQATAQNINVATLGNIFPLPVQLAGLANATVSLDGNLFNPQLRGSAELADATINSTPIQTATAQFLYQNAQLSLTSSLTANTPDQPLTLTAQIPYAFGFMNVQPKSDAIAVNVDVKNEGLALLNIFNQQVAWQAGQGEVNLQVGGTLASPQAQGFATLDKATLSAKILPQPLTNVTGRANFVGDRIVVENLQGDFGNGQLIAAGTLPLRSPLLTDAELSELAATPPAADPSNRSATSSGTSPLFPQPLTPDRPLTANLQNADLVLPNLYKGGVNGQIIVGGSVLGEGPKISGGIMLANGQVLLASESADSSADPSATLAAATVASSPNTSGITPEFRDLQLTLGNSIRVVKGNLLNFVADGTLLINGPFSDLQPNGTINIKSGRVNLYTTVFQLNGRNNTARFTPDMGLQNPFLNVSLLALVPLVDSPGPVESTPFLSAEVADTTNNGFPVSGSLRTLRVSAVVNGPANAIFDHLTLSSSPSRSQSELVGLIGGGFVTAIESAVNGGNPLQGAISLFSSPVLTRIQDLVGSTLNLSEFRLFPVTSASRLGTEKKGGTGFDIAAEADFGLTNSSTFSVGKILTSPSNPEFGINYRLSNDFSVSGRTNLNDINQVFLEYDIRF